MNLNMIFLIFLMPCVMGVKIYRNLVFKYNNKGSKTMQYKNWEIRQTKNRNVVIIGKNGENLILGKSKEFLSEEELKQIFDEYFGKEYGN